MDTYELKEHIKTLTQLTGPSGHEGEVRDYLRDEWSEFVDGFEVDGLGSLIAIKTGASLEPGRRIMLCAHMDEIGLMVADIKNGYLRLSNINGVDARTMLAKPVLIHTREGALNGIIAAPPPHITQYTGGARRYPDFSEQWVDLGLAPEKVHELVHIGDVVTIEAPPVELMGDAIAGKAIDDRSALASVTACLHYLQSRTHYWDVFAVASVQEEMGSFGAQTAAYDIQPDLAIAIDVDFAQQPGVSDDNFVKLGEGPTIGIGPNFHDGLIEGLQETARKLEMKLPVMPLPGNSGTDAWPIQVSRRGVPTALLNIPVRNMHTSVETVNVKDVERTGRLMAEYISRLTPDDLDAIAWKPEDSESDLKTEGRL